MNSRSCKFNPVHRNVDFRYVNRFFLAIHEIVVARDIGGVVADVAEERAERTVIVERQRQRADRAAFGLQLYRHIHRDAELGMTWALHLHWP